MSTPDKWKRIVPGCPKEKNPEFMWIQFYIQGNATLNILREIYTIV